MAVIPKQEKTKKTAPAQLVIKQYDLKGEEKGTINISDVIFHSPVNKTVIAQYIHVYRTNQRQGNVSTKTRAEVTGTTKKIYKQKGTGKARHGSKKAPIFVGGGVVGGPKPKDYELTINKKQRTLAFFGALTEKYNQQNIISLTVEEAALKTKDVYTFVKKMKLTDKKILFVLPQKGVERFILANRNIENVSNIFFHSVNAYEALHAHMIIFVNEALHELEKHFIKE